MTSWIRVILLFVIPLLFIECDASTAIRPQRYSPDKASWANGDGGYWQETANGNSIYIENPSAGGTTTEAPVPKI